MRLLGAHMSIAGGVDKAIDRGKLIGCTAIQIFVKNNNQWFNPPLDESEIKSFIAKMNESGIFMFAHTGYLINLASPDPDKHAKSIQSMLEEFEKCEELGLPFIVLHPGSHMDLGEEEGIKRVTHSINRLFKTTAGYKVKLALENTAGQGAALGYKFEHFRQWLDSIEDPDRLAICFDTCHAYAAGYDIKTSEGNEKTWEDFEKTVGLEKLMAFHLNDSKKALGSRVDRHEHIGQGLIGPDTFGRLLNDDRFKDLPMVIETPKDPEMKLDIMNLKILRALIKLPGS
jgi:deoxyribonuclease-4